MVLPSQHKTACFQICEPDKCVIWATARRAFRLVSGGVYQLNDQIMENYNTQREARNSQAYLASASADSFGLYHDMIKSSGATAFRTDNRFEATIVAHRFGRLSLFDRQILGARHRRDHTHIQRDGFDHYYIQALRSGIMFSGRVGEGRYLMPGDAIFFDATQPMESIVDNADFVTAIFPRDLVETAAPDARCLHGRILPRGGAGLLGELILSMARNATSFSEPLAAGSFQLIISTIGEIQEVPDSKYDDKFEQDALDLSRRLKAEIFIQNNLGADLSADLVARSIGVSRSSLYRAMYAAGGVQTVVTHRRAARLRSLILQPGKRLSIAHSSEEAGFVSISHGSRVFKKIYGQSPDHLRTIFESDASSLLKKLNPERLRDWYGDIKY